MNETPTPRPFRSIAEGIASEFASKDAHGEWWGHDTTLGDVPATIEKALEALAAEKDREAAYNKDLLRQFFLVMDDKDTCGAKRQLAEIASLRSEVERLTTANKNLADMEIALRLKRGKSVTPKLWEIHEKLSLALKERDTLNDKVQNLERQVRAYREVAIQQSLGRLVGPDEVDAEALRLLQVPGSDGGQKLSSEGKKGITGA